DDSEIRFTVGAGGGVKVFPTPHLGGRLDGRVFWTFLRARARVTHCSARVKVFPTPHLGVRLDGRVFATFLDADARFTACSPRGCFVAFDADVLWQADFTAGVVFRFP